MNSIQLYIDVFHTGSVCSFQIIGDNVDLQQKPSHQSVNRKCKEHHWFQIMAVRNRVSGAHLPNDHPKADIQSLHLSTFLPSVEDCTHLHRELVILASRVLVDKLPCFKYLQEVVPTHIPHQYSSQMMKKSEMVSMSFYGCFSRNGKMKS